MGKRRGVHETTPELRNRMVGMYEAGLGLREIAAAVHCSQRTVKRWLNRFDKEGTVETRERCGRKRATTVEQDEAIVKLATQTPISAAKAVLPALGLTCSVDTIRERLHKAGIHNWSPSRKYMQRISLGDTDGAAIQQPVWRPTGTQLGKKRSSRSPNKNEKVASSPKKRKAPLKIRARDVYVGDGAPVENIKQPSEQEEFIFPQHNAPPQPQTNEMQPPVHHLPMCQTEFANALSLTQQTQPPIYHHSGGLNISQNWPLDLVQGSHHYSQGQPNSITHEQPASQQLQELHAQPQQRQHHVQQVQPTISDQTHNLEQQQLQVPHQVQLNSSNQAPSTNLNSDGTNSSDTKDEIPPSSEKVKRNKKCTPNKSGYRSQQQQDSKKKGGKVKGTLETSVEIRNRMIGMAEAGLSTLSIALAIDRSERTVKRWLERWNKEGNVQTKERKGRRRITTKEQDDAIIAMATQYPLTAAKHVAPALGLKCSVDTIRERLHKAGIHSWKLGKKQGEGNAVHTVHLWQPSGNRPNKPKILGEKKRKSNVNKKRDSSLNGTPKQQPAKKEDPETTPPKMVPPPANMVLEQTTAQPFQNSATSPNVLQPVQNIPATSSTPVQPPPPAPQAMQPMGPMMPQRPDCRLAPPTVPSVAGQGSTSVTYPSCMVANSNHTGHMEQTDSIIFEPYIWSF